jgi:hypothetical protein
MTKVFLIFTCLIILNACGVKSDPQPPETPAELGRGRPLYRGDDDVQQPPPPQLPQQQYKKSEQKDDDEEAQ